MIRLINDVLELVSAEAGVLPVTFERENLDSIFQQVAQNHQSKASEKNQKIACDSQKLFVNADHKILIKVMNRLLDNAIKFGHENSTINIEAHPKNDTVTISVKNEGKGISPEMIEAIMKPFTLDENMMNHSKGFGLGLSLTQALLKRVSSGLHISSENQNITVSFNMNRSD